VLRRIGAWFFGLSGVLSWVFHETIKAYVFDKVVHQMKPYEATALESVVQYGVVWGVPLLFMLICIYLIRPRRKAAQDGLSSSATETRRELAELMYGAQPSAVPNSATASENFPDLTIRELYVDFNLVRYQF
jgi:hypothetical protein